MQVVARVTIGSSCAKIKILLSIPISTTRFVFSSFVIVWESVGLVIPLKCVIALASTIARIGATLLASPKPSIVSKVIFSSRGCGFSATAEATSIFLPSLCSSLFYELNLDVDLEWVYILLNLKGGTIRFGIMC